MGGFNLNKVYIKKILSLLIVLSMLIPTVVFANVVVDESIKFVYFEDENGQMVRVDYAEAIRQSMEEHDDVLYEAIKEYVGIAEEKGRLIYLETTSGRILDYGKAMLNNLFKLKDFIGKEEYEVDGEIEYTHELLVIDGEAGIVEITDEIDTIDIVSIASVSDITVDIGTSEEEAIRQLAKNTTIKDSEGNTHTVSLSWTMESYDGDVVGEYEAIGRFELPEGIENNGRLKLEVEAIVKVVEPEVEDWPEEVEDVVVGKSQITENTYANIEIKTEYLSEIEGVYVDDELAINMEERPSQWRIKVADGTTVEVLKGRISVALNKEEVIVAEFFHDSLLGRGFELGKLVVNIENPRGYKDAVKYRVEYTVGSSTTTVLTGMTDLGEAPEDLVQYIEGVSVINIILYDAHGTEIGIIEDIMNR